MKVGSRQMMLFTSISTACFCRVVSLNVAKLIRVLTKIMNLLTGISGCMKQFNALTGMHAPHHIGIGRRLLWSIQDFEHAKVKLDSQDDVMLGVYQSQHLSNRWNREIVGNDLPTSRALTNFPAIPLASLSMKG